MDEQEDLIEMADLYTPSIIKVIGVGGGGGNAVAKMYRDEIPEVRCVVANTDHKALEDNIVPNHLQMGPGLGAGGSPEKGRELAEQDIEAIRAELDDETKMIFITAGMGNGTGTGASPIIAREARKKGILTIGIVTIPFRFEGKVRIDKALDGLEVLADEVDAMLVINNERLREIYADLSLVNAFKKADQTLSTAVSSITEIITMHGRITLDFEDVKNTLTDGGVAIMSTGYGEGENRVTHAIHEAINSPLINNKNIYEATHVLLSITSADETGKALLTSELDEVTAFMNKFNSDVVTKWGLSFDKNLGSKIKITIIASGFGLYGKRKKKVTAKAPTDAEKDGFEERMSKFYTESAKKYARRPKIYLFSGEDLYNDDVIKLVEESPTRRRTGDKLAEIKEKSATKQ